MKKLISSIAVVSLLGVSTLSANGLSKSDSEFLGLTSTNAIALDSKEMVLTSGKEPVTVALVLSSMAAAAAWGWAYNVYAKNKAAKEEAKKNNPKYKK